MRASTIDWIQHGNMPINSVDVQPRGYRILTGGNDNKVCIWNLLPIVSRHYETKGSYSDSPAADASGGKPNKPGKEEEQKIEVEIQDYKVSQILHINW